MRLMLPRVATSSLIEGSVSSKDGVTMVKRGQKKLVLHQADFAVLAKRKRPKSFLRSSRNLLPVKEIIAQADGTAVIVLNDGTSRQIIEIDPSPLLHMDEDGRLNFHNEFKVLLAQTNFDFQLMMCSRALSQNAVRSTLEAMPKRDMDYTQWFGDYLQKWALQCIGVSGAMKTRCFAIVSSSELKNHQKLRGNANQLWNWFKRVDAIPRFLDREETRRLLYSMMHPYFEDDEVPALLPESESSSKVPTPDRTEETQSCLVSNSFYTRSFYVSHLPVDLQFGLHKTAVKPHTPFTLSVHFHSASKGRKKVSIYSSVFSNEKDNLDFNAEETFDTNYRFRSADWWQYEAWLSNLPLGWDAAGATNEIDIESASKLYALVGAPKGDESGTLLGFNLADRNPLYVNFSSQSQVDPNLLIVSSKQKQREIVAGILAMRLICEDVRLAIWDGPGTMKWLAELLGKDVYRWDDENSFASASEDFVYFSGFPDQKRRTELLKKFLGDGIDIRTDKDAKRIVFVINEDAEVVSSESLGITGLLNKLPQNTSTVLACEADGLIQTPDLKICFSRTLLLELDKLHAEEIAKILHLSKSVLETLETFRESKSDKNALLALLTGAVTEGVFILHSPIEYWTVMPGVDAELREKMDHIASIHSGIDDVDKVRQAIYYLGVEREYFRSW